MHRNKYYIIYVWQSSGSFTTPDNQPVASCNVNNAQANVWFDGSDLA